LERYSTRAGHLRAMADLELLEDELVQKFADRRRRLLDEYRQPHANPWIIRYLGGKDSTLVAHLGFEMQIELPRSERLVRVHIVANDTLVESPLVVSHINATMAQFDEAAFCILKSVANCQKIEALIQAEHSSETKEQKWSSGTAPSFYPRTTCRPTLGAST
jgi:3'-phosphoadenosine 5'-phosphosulfate sulfotransferase (PAPS reductase)/FAD synthetase